jgi:glycosyltransferase involved in cell wall biosynthesis
MRVLVYPHDLGIGGSQLNAIELAGAVRDQGHEVLVFGPAGPLEGRIEELGLEFIAAPTPRRRPSPSIVAALRRVVDECGIDVVHGYEWPPILESRLAVWGRGTACVGTVMSMAVAPFIPQHLPLVVGTEQIADAERRQGRRRVHVVEPPVDLAHNQPVDPREVDSFRSRFGIPGGTCVVAVSRLAHELKLEGILTAIDVVPTIDGAVLVVVGDGPARHEVVAAADAANRRAGRVAVRVIGQMADPRAAYTSADVVIGMGGSALRAMAFGKPLVVQGEQGFWDLLTPVTVDQFLWTGWFGVGEARTVGAQRLRSILVPLLADEGLRRSLGAFSSDVVRKRFALDQAGVRQADIYREALTGPPQSSAHPVLDGAAAFRFAVHTVRRRAGKLRGNRPSDDFNARPVAAAAKREGVAS